MARNVSLFAMTWVEARAWFAKKTLIVAGVDSNDAAGNTGRAARRNRTRAADWLAHGFPSEWRLA